VNWKPEGEEVPMLSLDAIAAAIVLYLTPYLAEVGKGAAKKVGETAGEKVVKLYDTLKAKLTHPFAREALANLAKAPTDADTQATFRTQLKKVLADDSQLRDELGALVETLDRETGGVRQHITMTGDDNVGIQVAGSGNTVMPPGRRSE
jgi:hypothetical protein